MVKQKFTKTTYIIRYKNGRTEILSGIEALAGFHSNEFYTVEGIEGRELSEAEMDEWERLTEVAFEGVTLSKGSTD